MRGLPHCVDCKCTSFYFHLGYSWSHSWLFSPVTHPDTSYLVWMCCGVIPILFGWSLRVPSLHELVFIWKNLIIHIHKSAKLSGDSSNYYRMAGGIMATIHWWSLNRKHGQGLAGRETLGLRDLEKHANLRWVDNTCLIIWFMHLVYASSSYTLLLYHIIPQSLCLIHTHSNFGNSRWLRQFWHNYSIKVT